MSTYVSLQQEDVVTSKHMYKLINGCAGSHKTDTLLKCLVYDINKGIIPRGGSVLFLSLISSVTDEVRTRLTKMINSPSIVRGGHHYVSMHKGVSICVSNFDAWIHQMLRPYIQDLELEGASFNLKAERLYENITESPFCKCKSKASEDVNLVIIDEVQDLDPRKMGIIVALCELNPLMRCYVAGDKLQSIFNHEKEAVFEHDMYHPMDIFGKIKPKVFYLDTCFRCPKSHITFANCVMSKYQKELGLPPMLPSNSNLCDKPFLFTQETSKYGNMSSYATSLYISKIVECLFIHDQTIKPEDMVFISPTSNSLDIFNKIEEQLKSTFLKYGYRSCICRFKTVGEGYHHTINWEKARGKCAILSIHGDKGMGHKVVFLLGATEGSVPRIANVFKPKELFDISLLNVGLTRSTKYLFVGFSQVCPSRYIKDYVFNKDLCHLAWERDECIPEPYKSMQKLGNKRPLIKDKYYRGEDYVLKGGSKTCLQVRDDISKRFERVSDFASGLSEVLEEPFGNTIKLSQDLNEDHKEILGVLCELLIRKAVSRKAFKNSLVKVASSIYFTDDERLICSYHDSQRMSPSEFHKYIDSHYFRNEAELSDTLIRIRTQGMKVVHSSFREELISSQIKEFFSAKEASSISSTHLWNVTLFWIQLNSMWYRPSINRMIGYLNCDLTLLHSNIKVYASSLKGKGNLLFEVPLRISSRLNDDELRYLNKHKQVSHMSTKYDLSVLSLSGRADLVQLIRDQKDNITSIRVIEFKASHLDTCSPHWVIQVLCYLMLLEQTLNPLKDLITSDVFKKVEIVNMLQGVKYSYAIDETPDLKGIISRVLPKLYDWDSIEVESLLKAF